MKIRLKDMTPKERTAYNTNIKRQTRERERVERLAKQTPSAHEYELPQTQQRALHENTELILKSIQAESRTDEYIVDMVAGVILGFEKGYIQKVTEPFGQLVGGYFPDAAASTVIETIHRFPMLLQSAAFTTLYQKFLKLVATWNNKTHGAYSTPEFIRDLNRELDGTYILETAAIGTCDPPPSRVDVPAAAPTCNIFPRAQVQRIDSNISDAARRYLDGL